MNYATEIKYGVLLGLFLCFYTVFMWITKLDTSYLEIGQYLDIAVILLPISLTILAIRAKTKIGNLTILSRILCGILVNVIGTIVYNPFLYAYHTFINPLWQKFALDLMEKNLIAQNIEKSIIDQTLVAFANSSSFLSQLTGGVIAGIILGVLIALVSLIFIRNQKNILQS
jgi:hypothetical protein